MPCSDGGPSREQLEDERQRNREQSRLPGLLCSAARALERLGYDFDENPELSDWWAKHKKEDDARIAHENAAKERKVWADRIVKEALKKPISELTAEEKKLLKERNFF